MTVTDELLAELEELAFECNQHGGNWYEPRHMAAFPEYSCDQDFVVSASPETITALTTELRRLRAENAELAKDAGRYRWIVKKSTYGISYRQCPELTLPIYAPDHRDGLGDAIDTAMADQ